MDIDYDLYDYKLVKFLEESVDVVLPHVIDIVYKDWVYFNTKLGVCETRFPPSPYGAIKSKYLFKKLIEKSEAPANWESYEIEIVGHAKSYNEALERLQELRKKSFAFTDNENASKKSEAMKRELQRRANAAALNEKKADEHFSDNVCSLSEIETEADEPSSSKRKDKQFISKFKNPNRKRRCHNFQVHLKPLLLKIIKKSEASQSFIQW
ncbi:uncharacterized protein LOC118750321 [Rhagoletis pomonella]|uniref:uncharacterized protein LOC118750321 n=1 Tax=Rhagoletis pomonella TaxID=28610 RepID=UPI0017865A10|nr:uncharacterized protein LOC118750321 [Rhagoletis pomonella]XP_036340933.1 uncharacterized protein LOC118750321 [Rhagoletis pomonella]